jgi:RAQPRD family integrative conjugative element protein
MTTTGKPTTDCRRAPALALVLAVALANASPASAGDASPEHAQLAALVRQLDLLERTARHSASLARDERARYHFDYARLHQDIGRIRAGINDYLVPQRAQPRDPVPLAGDYVRRDRADDEEPSP